MLPLQIVQHLFADVAAQVECIGRIRGAHQKPDFNRAVLRL